MINIQQRSARTAAIASLLRPVVHMRGNHAGSASLNEGPSSLSGLFVVHEFAAGEQENAHFINGRMLPENGIEFSLLDDFCG